MKYGNSSDGIRGWRAAGPAASARQFALAVLVFLCYPAVQLAGAPLDAARLTVTLLATLLVVAIYLWLVWHRQSRDRPRCLAAVVIMTAAGVAVPPAWGATWLGLLLFPAVGAALVLPAAAGVLTAAVLTAVLAAEGLALGAPGGLILSLGLVTILAGLAAAGYMRFAETSSQLRSAQAELAALAVARERARIGRDLHDAVRQHLFVASMQLGAARERIAGSAAGAVAARAHLDDAADAVRLAQSGLAGLIRQTRPVGHCDGAGLAERLRALVTVTAGRAGFRARFEATGGGCELPAGAAAAMVLACQEALANIARHAGAAEVLVQLDSCADGTRVQISDDGTGIDDGGNGPGGGDGLVIMRERMAEAGGAAEIRSSPGQGTTVMLRWPASPAQAVR